MLTRTVLNNPYIPHVPTARQGVFLSLPHADAFYGGAAGGGKSDALLMAALQFVDQPNYAAILFRRTYADLALPGALMDRAHDWLGPTDARWADKDKQWVFPSNATINFGYLESDRDRYRYQSSEFQFVGFDELTQFSAVQHGYLFSRLRKLKSASIPLRMRGASNPGNVGHQYVKERYVDPGDADRPFIPAKLRDNPHVDQESYSRMLLNLDEPTRRQLADGIWDEPINEGAYYKQQYEKTEAERRIGFVPYEPMLQVDTFWDLGTASGRDSMTVWFVQRFGREIRIIDCYGVGGEGFPHMAQVLRERGYNFGKHYAPHDIVVKEMGTGKTRLEQAKALGIRFERVPDIGVAEGIAAARLLFDRCWFDKTKCATGLRALKNYRKEWDERGQCWKDHPLKDWTADYADAFRMMAVGIKELPQGLPPPKVVTDYRIFRR